MKDIGPNPRLNMVASALIGILAMFFFYLAYETYILIESDEWAFVAVLAGIGSILLLCALLFWRSPPVNAARLSFRSGGFQLETKQVFRRRKVFELDWADISTVSLHNGGLYGGRSIHLSHGRAGKVASFSPAWTNCSSKDVIDRLMTSAKASGYMLEKEAVGWRAVFLERWTLIQKT
jgi:hypothetical protein